MHRPNVGDRRGEQPPPRTRGCPSCTVPQARRASRDGSSSLLVEIAERRGRAATLVPSRDRTPSNGRSHSAGHTGYHSCDLTKGWSGPTSAPSLRSRVPTFHPQRVRPYCHETLETESRRRKVRVILLDVGDRKSQLRPGAWKAVSPSNGTTTLRGA